MFSCDDYVPKHVCFVCEYFLAVPLATRMIKDHCHLLAVDFIKVSGIAAIFRHGGRVWIYMMHLLPC